MSEQKSFVDVEYEIVSSGPIIAPNLSHMALAFVVDISGSMSGTPINELNAALNRFKSEVCEDKNTRRILDIAIVTFNHETKIVQNFRSITEMEPVNLVASGGTSMSEAIETAIQLINARSREYQNSGATPYKPWIILISDGMPGDNIDDTAREVRALEDKGKLKFWSLGVEGYDANTLKKFSKRVMKLEGYSFYGFLDWASKSMRAVSVSAPTEEPKIPDLPKEVKPDTNPMPVGW